MNARAQCARAQDAASAFAADCIHDLFERRAARTPHAVALIFEDARLSYAELNERANRLAHHLMALGVRPESRVAIALERGIEMIVALLATLKAGAAYVPLDPAYPAARLAHMLADSEPSVLLTESAVRAVLPPLPEGLRTLELDAPAPAWRSCSPRDPDRSALGLEPQHLAYVIYTSGSTGLPKGVMVEHRNVVRLFRSTEHWFGFAAHDVWTMFHSFAFDFSVWEIWGALLYGGQLVVVSQAQSRAPRDFYELLCRHRVTVLNQTPSAFRQLIAAQAQSTLAHSLRSVIFGGEALECASLKPWFAQHRNASTQLVNMYGITETTVHVTYHPLTPADTERIGASPIGVRIPDLRVHLLDDERRPVPVGTTGELYIGGAGVARGYLNREALTAERFLADPFAEASAAEPRPRMYRSGDLGRRLPDGSIEFLGRNDHQVKIRGFRIELGEIEARLLACPGVREAVVLGREDSAGHRQLVAYFVASDDRCDTGAKALRQQLLTALPDYMVPPAYVRMDALPLTTHGKLDREAVPAPAAHDFAASAYEAPIDDLERTLAGLWRDILNIEHIGRHDDFFDLGGDSLRLTELHLQLERRFARMRLDALVDAATVARQAGLLRGEADQLDGLLTIRPGPATTALFLVHDGFGETLVYRNLARLLASELPVYGVIPKSAGGIGMVHTSVTEIAAHYVANIRRVQPHGPYLLGGLCTGGVIAFEMALQLQRMGERVGMLALIDASAAHARKRVGHYAKTQLAKIAEALEPRASWMRPMETVGGAFGFAAALVKLIARQTAVRAATVSGDLRARLLKLCLRRGRRWPAWLRAPSVDQIYALAESGYRPHGPLHGDVLLFKATQGNGEMGDVPFGELYIDAHLGWAELVGGRVHVFDLPGGHYSMLQMPHAEALAGALQRHIETIVPPPAPLKTPSR